MAMSKLIYNFMLLGKTGYGKSSTGNTLINRRNIFKESNQMNSCTQEPKLECASFENYDIKVVDTPGLQDTKNIDLTVTLNCISNAMALLPDGFDALLLVMKYGERCTKEVVELISALRATFGEVFAKEYCIIVITHGEMFDMDMRDEDHPYTFDDYCKKIKEPPEFLYLLKDCDYRVVLFYNKTEVKREESISRLLQLVQIMKHQSKRYNLDIFAKFATERNKHVISLKCSQLTDRFEGKVSFLTQKMSLDKRTFNFILLGGTCTGKSATGNNLINRRNVFKASNQTGACTNVPQLECGSFEDYNIRVVDTPGLKDTNIDITVTLDHIGNAMALLSDGFDALLLVMKYGKRCTKEVGEVITALRATFGEVFAKEYCIIVMTHGDMFDMDMSDEDQPYTFDDYCKKIKEPPEFVSLLKDCDYRVVLFYNKTKGKREETIERLLKLVQTRKNRGQRYNSDIFAKCTKERSKYVISLKRQQLISSIQEKLSFLKEALEKSIENPDAKFDLEVKIKAQQLLDTIEVESDGTSLMDDLKNDVRRIINSLNALTSQRQVRQQKLQ